MSSTKDRREELHTDHFVSGKDKRAERRAQDILRRAYDLDEDDWDILDLSGKEVRPKRHQRLE